MNRTRDPERLQATGQVTANVPASAGLIRLDLEVGQPVRFAPGQFAMLNLTGTEATILGRPFSILASDGTVVSFLYRVVGRGTARLARLRPGGAVTFFGPLGRSFPPPQENLPVIVVAGGVGLPPLHAWWRRYRRTGDRAYFGGRDGADVPWGLLEDDWRVSVDRLAQIPPGRTPWEGRVVDYGRADTDTDAAPRQLLACGPAPLLRAAAAWAAARGWPCLVSVEEHMGCGYGVCKGCMVPLVASAGLAEAAPPYAACCEEGPVFAADRIDWDTFVPAE